MGYDRSFAANELNEIGELDEFGEPNDDSWQMNQQMSQQQQMNQQQNQLNQMNSMDVMNGRAIGDENSYKQFLEFEQQEQLSKMMLADQAPAYSLDEDYLRQGEQLEEDGSTDNEEVAAINQCQLDSNYSTNQINQINQQQQQQGNLLHLANGMGEVYTVIDTIPEETEDDLTSPDSVTAKKNLDGGPLKYGAPAAVSLAGVADSGQHLSQAAGQTTGQANGQTHLVQQPMSGQASGQASGQPSSQANPISQAQTVENLIKTNDSEAAKKLDLINSAAISDSISHRQAGHLPASDLRPAPPPLPPTSAADQWKAKPYSESYLGSYPGSCAGSYPAATSAPCFAGAVSQSVQAANPLSNQLSDQQQAFARGKNSPKKTLKIKLN